MVGGEEKAAKTADCEARASSSSSVERTEETSDAVRTVRAEPRGLGSGFGDGMDSCLVMMNQSSSDLEV